MALVLRKNGGLKGGGKKRERERERERAGNVEQWRKRDFTIARGDGSIDDHRAQGVHDKSLVKYAT